MGACLLTNILLVKLALGVLQIAIAISAIVGAVLLQFNILILESTVAAEASSFYVAFLVTFGIVFVISGLFLVYDWRESALKREIDEAI